MIATHTAKRLLPFALAASVVVAVFAGAANGRTQSVTFVAGPDRVVQGNPATFTVNVAPSGARCSLAVRYKSGAKQKGLRTVSAAGGKASWTWTVSKTVQTGRATVTASCAGAGRASRNMTVIGQVLPPRIDVVQTGYSIRTYPFGGTGVSWGVILANRSKTQDALDVNVICNMVMDDNRLIGTASTHINDITANSQHATGGELNFLGGAPVARLEVVVQIGKSGPATHLKPGISFIRLTPSTFEPQWTGEIDGEIQNDSTNKTLQSAQISGVVFDAEGSIIGGGSGFTVGSLPPAARMVMKITNGMRPILYAKAASALVSIAPSYK
jgi:hypothetical protein